MDDFSFDADEFLASNPQPDYAPLPAGVHPVMVVEAERKPTKRGDGELLELVIEVIQGPHKGRRFFDRLNLWNPNPAAVAIANASLAKLIKALGLSKISRVNDLCGIPCDVRTVLTRYTTDSGEERFSPSVKAYLPRSYAKTAEADASDPF